MRRHPAMRGFTLLELIGALALAAIALAVLMQVLAGSAQLSERADRAGGAALRAQSKLAELGTLRRLVPGRSEGRFDARYRWRLTVAPWQPRDGGPVSAPGLQLLRVDLEVLWTGGSADFSTLRLVQTRGPGIPP